MRIGIVLADGTWSQIVDAAATADAGGLDAVGFWDHYHSANPAFAPHNGWAVYGFLASATRRIRLCPLVLDGPNYRTGRLAKESAMLAILSGGRFDLGIGVGDIPEEEAAWGEPPYADAATRLDWLEETVAALRLVWSGEPVDFGGRHVRLQGACCPPAPPAPLPVVIGAGRSKRLARRAAAYADEINVYNDAAAITAAREAIAGSGRAVRLSTCTEEFEVFGNQVPVTAVDQLERWREQRIDRLFITLYAPFTLLPRLCDAVARLDASA